MVNKIILLGRIGKKESKMTSKGTPMTSLSIATNRKYKDSQGQQHEVATWHTVYFFTKMAEIADKYTNKGDLIYIEGEVNHKKIEDDKGARWIYSISGKELKLLTPGRKNDNNQEPRKQENVQSYEFDDDIPF